MYDDTQFRAQLGSRLVLFSVGALVLLGIAIMVSAAFAGAEAVKNAAQLLLSSLLPVFGTWIGTVLAFYYTKENFESASRGTLDVVRAVTQRLTSTRVADAMMPRERIITLSIPARGSLRDVQVADVAAKFDSKGANGQRISRLPIVGADGICRGLLHRGMWAEMLANAVQPFDPTTARLDTLLTLPYPLREGQTYEEAILGSIAFVKENASVADAKAAMEQVRGCQDVIVTASGTRTEPFLGWISNVDIGRLLQG
jgi:CBS domain-containing protein